MQLQADGLAQWIWSDGDESPRNEWRCFRKSFEVPTKGWDSAKIAITADSRYVLYINGELLGRGPARSWPSEQFYDVYDIGRLLKPGKSNTVAVLVQHFGLSTFYYLRGRGGLVALLELHSQDQKVKAIGTDGSWLTSRHLGQDPRAPRMSTQNAFAERIDARQWDNAWVNPDYDDTDWTQATLIGPVGMEPWTRLVPRDIPFLTEEPIYAARVERLSKVKPIRWNAYIDIRNQMIPGSESHMNAVTFGGYLATVIRVPKKTKAILGFPNSSIFGPLTLGGVTYTAEQFYGDAPEKYVAVELSEGDNLFYMDITGADHAVGFYMGIDCEEPFKVVSPHTSGESESPFVTLGPFEYNVVASRPVDRKVVCTHPDYIQAKGLSSKEQLTDFQEWLRPVPKVLVDEDNVFTLSVWKNRTEALAVSNQLQNIVKASPMPAEIPLFNGQDTEMIIDFGRLTSGFITFEAECPAGTILDFYGFEFMEDGWRQETYKLNNTLRYVCRDGFQSYVSSIRRGLRYLMVTVRRGEMEGERPILLYNIGMKQSTYPVTDIGRFQCSDALLTKIWDISQRTVRLCMEDTFVDCPTYEQTFWVGDARNEALIGYYLFDAEPLVRHSLGLVPGSAGQTPYYVSQVPSGWSSVIPNWTFFWVTACKEYYQRTADVAFVEQIWPHIRFTLDHYLAHLNEQGLFDFQGWNFFDWAEIDQPNDGVVTHQNLFLMKALQEASELAQLAGDQQTTVIYDQAAEKLLKAINLHLWSEDGKAYLDCIHADGRKSDRFSMQTQVVASLCEAAKGDREAIIDRYLVDSPSEYVQVGSPFMSFFYYEALAQKGLYSQMLEDIRTRFGQMIEHDATACWEMFPNSTNRQNEKFLSRSHCHAWSAAPGYFFSAYVLGVRSRVPGWQELIVEPNPCGLEWARGSVPLPVEGRIDVFWKVEEQGKIAIRVEAPSHIHVDIRVPKRL
ncbi:family 78 glycoside hydrolase catalytic domain [Paenibacillus sp. V4I5]|uniref:family 78 glycoside hydrolase catalytic domain n=1 Tax=Paenibacillus sp. V4I5 TaxID=3042306 RepID=UPI002790DF82|nr:family 78 glycoside hydrolase catalytic domain [Paenibacillus sp. V4I5]MDQ0920241.1 alpha-L-rhamnosidase [Paenibacillus sp. V4I5]